MWLLFLNNIGHPSIRQTLKKPNTALFEICLDGAKLEVRLICPSCTSEDPSNIQMQNLA